MSGHSKWSQIKRKKGVKDQQRGKIFSKLARLITLSVLEGGGTTDPASNVKLRMAIEKAKSENMPKENINRAIERGVGPQKAQLQEVFYEGFGPAGTAYMIQVTTDNANRTISEVRTTLERYGGKLGNQGSVSYLFKKCASVVFDKSEKSEEEIFSFAEKVSAFDMEEDSSAVTVYFPFENLGKIEGGELDFKPLSTVKIQSESEAKKILVLMEALENLDEVLKVFSNFDIQEEFLQR